VVGRGVGWGVGLNVGGGVGSPGAAVGAGAGGTVGLNVGATDGLNVGATDGLGVGATDGLGVGAAVGLGVGLTVGGGDVGLSDSGSCDGDIDLSGSCDGILTGASVYEVDGCEATSSSAGAGLVEPAPRSREIVDVTTPPCESDDADASASRPSTHSATVTFLPQRRSGRTFARTSSSVELAAGAAPYIVWKKCCEKRAQRRVIKTQSSEHV